MGGLHTDMPKTRTTQKKPLPAAEERTSISSPRRKTEEVPALREPLPRPGDEDGGVVFLVPERLKRQILNAADAASISIPPGTLFCDTRSTLPSKPQRKVVVFTDGRLSPAAAATLRRADRPLLCALRKEGLASDWELSMALSCLGSQFSKPRTALWTKRTVSSYQQMVECADWANALVERAGLPNSVQAQVADVAHELVTNALLSAPMDAKGRPKYALHRQDADVDPEDACELHVGIENARVYLLAVDRHGTLSLDPILHAVQAFEARAKVNDAGGGAGLGFRRILEHSDVLLARVSRKKSTSVLSAISAEDVRRRRSSPKSVFLIDA